MTCVKRRWRRARASWDHAPRGRLPGPGMNHVVIGIVFAVLGALFGAVLLDGGGALFGLVSGLMAAALVRQSDRLRRVEATLLELQRAATSIAPAPPAQASAEPAPAAGFPDMARTPLAERLGVLPDAEDAEFAPGPEPAGPATAETAREAPCAGAEAPVAREPGPFGRGWNWLRTYATTGNVVAKVGVLVLFFGVSFLLKYAIDRNVVSIELRLMGTAAAAIALIVTGWRLRGRRAGFAWVLQGGGVGLLYLTVFAAARLYGVLPMGFAFALLVAIVALSSLLAVLQDARALAVLGVAGGFLAPVLTSTGGGSHVALFSYYALLNAGIVGIAWFKAWRILNLTGFAFTFVISGFWGYNYYRPEHFATTEPFLVLSFLFYLAVSVLFALRHPPRLTGYVDGTLVFGLPLVVFAMQANLVRDIPFGRAWSALGMGAIYLGTALFLRRRAIAHMEMLTEALIALGVVAASLAIPFAFDGHLTAAAWALEGAGLVWIGLRQDRLRARLAGLLLQLAAGTAYFAMVASHSPDATPVLNAQYLGSLMVGIGALFASRMLEAGRAGLRPWERFAAPALLAWGLLWWYGAGLHEIGLHVRAAREPAATFAFLGASGAALAFVARRTGWRQATFASWLHAPLALLLALLVHADGAAAGPLADGRVAGWLLVVGAAWYATRLGEQAWPRTGALLAHALSLWLSLFLLAWAAAWAIGRIGGHAWSLAAWAVVAVAALLLVPVLVARPAWPFARVAALYRSDALTPVAAWSLGWIVYAGAFAGDPRPLPFLPLANPLDLAGACCLLAVLAWWRGARGQRPLGEAVLRRALLPLVGVTGFLWLNIAAARAVHALAGVGYSLYWLHRSAVFQGTISVLWGATALAVMVTATRRAARPAWMAGAALLGLLVLKLFLVDLGDRGTVARIVSFIAAGGLMMLIGYLSPVPPRTPDGASR
jgi:uncharacterized membrane protein